jgi:rSAM/selenodomain-associated transferase 2
MKNQAGKPRLAIVIPTLDEEALLAATLDSLAAQRNEAAQVVVADGGSTDRTAWLAQSWGAGVVVVPRRGRGCQIATALRQIEEEVVLILHADMILPAGALALLRERLAKDRACPGGCFGHRFDSPRLIYRLIEQCDRLRARRGMSYGDQAQFFRRDLLESRGGFPDQPIMEDVELSRRLALLGRPAYLDLPVVVSPRRFERLGWRRTVLGNLGLRLAYRYFGPRACEAIYQRYYGDSGRGGELVTERAGENPQFARVNAEGWQRASELSRA